MTISVGGMYSLNHQLFQILCIFTILPVLYFAYVKVINVIFRTSMLGYRMSIASPKE